MITAGALDLGECADAEPPRASGAQRAIRGFPPNVQIPQPRAAYAQLTVALGLSIPAPYTAPAVPTADDSDLRTLAARFQQLMRAYPFNWSAGIQVKPQASKRRLRARGCHRRPGPTARMYSRLGLIVQLGNSPRSLTGAAVIIAGKKHTAEHEEWRSHLSGWTGWGLARKDQVRAARGFLLAAVRYRFQDVAALMWRPLDELLSSRGLSNLFMMAPTAISALYILRHEGTLGVLKAAESISAIGGLLYGLIRPAGGGATSSLQSPRPGASRSYGRGHVRLPVAC